MYTPQLKEIIFRTKKGEMLHISCCGESEFSIEEGYYNGRWKGLEYRLDTETDWREDDGFEKYLPSATPVAFFFDKAELAELGYGKDFVPTCTKAYIRICLDGLNYEFYEEELVNEHKEDDK